MYHTKIQFILFDQASYAARADNFAHILIHVKQIFDISYLQFRRKTTLATRMKSE